MKIKFLVKKIFSGEIVDFLKKVKVKYFASNQEIAFVVSQKELLAKRSRFYSNYVKPGELCFDVGANVGNRVDALLNIGAKVVAIEPQEACFSFLEKKYGDKIQLVKKGIGAEEGMHDFYISNANVLSSFSTDWIKSVEASNRFENTKWSKVIKTEITTLDILIKEFGLPVFIKIDIEGYEAEALEGLSHPIKTLSFEYTVPEQIDKVVACLERLERIDMNIECNYCIGEQMEMVLDHWVSSSDMKVLLSNHKFITSGFGDIYVKFKSI